MPVMCQCYFNFGVSNTVYGTDRPVSETSCTESSGYAVGDDLPLCGSAGGGGIVYGDSLLLTGEWSKVAGVQAIWSLCGTAPAAQCCPCRACIPSDAVPALSFAGCEKNPPKMAGKEPGDSCYWAVVPVFCFGCLM